MGPIADEAQVGLIAEGSVEECRHYLVLSQDLGYGQTETLTSTLEEASKLLNPYVRTILASGPDFRLHIPQGYQGRSSSLVRRQQ